jgi:hypothetical protein
MAINRLTFSTAVGIMLAVAAFCTGRALAQPTPSPTPSSSPSTSTKSPWTVDPCRLLGSNDLYDVVGSVNPHPQHPTADECLWNAAVQQHTPHSVSQVLLTVDTAVNAKGCHGLNCVYYLRAVTGYVPGMDRFNQTFDELGEGAVLISGLGQRAGWGHGILAVLDNDTIFKLQLTGSQSDMLDASELLARKIIYNMASP